MEATDVHLRWYEAVALILLVYIAPVLLILFGIIPFAYKFYVLLAGTVAIGLYGWARGVSPAEVGIRRENLVASIRHVLPLTLILLVAAVVAYTFGSFKRIPTESFGFYIFYVFISSPSQEFLFRGALTYLLRSVGLSAAVRIPVSSLLYSFLHIIYRDPLTLLLTFVLGVLWGYSYEKYRNLAGVSVSHAALGVVSILVGAID